jgi:hypothetical protein
LHFSVLLLRAMAWYVWISSISITKNWLSEKNDKINMHMLLNLYYHYKHSMTWTKKERFMTYFGNFLLYELNFFYKFKALISFVIFKSNIKLTNLEATKINQACFQKLFIVNDFFLFSSCKLHVALPLSLLVTGKFLTVVYIGHFFG